jgi:hypothetical protein
MSELGIENRVIENRVKKIEFIVPAQITKL